METTEENIQATMEKEKVMASLDIEETLNSVVYVFVLCYTNGLSACVL